MVLSDNNNMKGGVITLVLITVIIVFLTIMVLGWTMANTSGFFEMSEINSVREEFKDCNDKILETARTGLYNKCIFSVERGQIAATRNDITYQIVTNERICDASDWVIINPEKNMWQSCFISGKQTVYGLRWEMDGIKFQFESIGNVNVTGQTGKTIEMNRASMNETQINLLLNLW